MSSSSLINKRANQPIHGPCCSSAETVTCKLLENTQISMSLLVIHNIFLSSRLVTVIVYCLYILFLICWWYVHHFSLFCWSEEKTPNLSPRWLVADWMTVCPTDTKEKVSYENECSSFFFENNRNYVLKPLPRADPQCFSHFPYGNAWVCMRVCVCVWNIR